MRLLNTNWRHVNVLILGINDNGVRDLAHPLYYGGLVRITSHPRDKLIENLEEKNEQ